MSHHHAHNIDHLTLLLTNRSFQHKCFIGGPAQVTGPLAATAEYTDPPGPVPPADASEADLEALQAQAWAAASLSVAGVTVRGVKGQVQGYSCCSFRVEFTPQVAGAHVGALQVPCWSHASWHSLSTMD